MKIQYVSDIHLEFYSKTPKIIPVADILVLAGDIGYPYSKIYTQFLKEMNTIFKKVFLITGNHEYYTDKDIEVVDEQIQNIIHIHNLKNISFLNCSYEDYEGYRFIGATLWSFINNPSYTINDITQIKNFSIEFNNELHELHKEYIKDTIEESTLPVIIITHHIPSFRLIDKEFLTETLKPYNQCFASNCESLMKEPVAVWIYGHTHKENTSVINSINVLCNPLGYPSERNKKDLRENLKKYIELE